MYADMKYLPIFVHRIYIFPEDKNLNVVFCYDCFLIFRQFW
jgi:hypothetical protein